MRYYADEVNLHARIYAMRSRLLMLRDYTAIIRDRNAFSETITGADEYARARETVFTEQIQAVIRLAEATRTYAPLFLAFLRQYEAHNLKLLLARAFGRQCLEQWYDIGPYATLGRGLLKKEPALDEIRSMLAGTYLDGLLDDTASYERLEMRLDLRTAENLHASSAPFQPSARNDFQGIMLRRVAVLAVIWHRRLKESYHWDDDQIQSHLERLSELFDGSPAPHVKIVQEAMNRRLELERKSGGPSPGAEDVEYYLEQYFHRWICSIFHKDFHSVHCVVAYLWLLYYQIKNLLRIIDGRHLGLSPEAIFERIVCEV